MFQETNNQDTFQGRYVLRHPFAGEAKCAEGRRYQRSLRQRFEQQSQNLARLTGWTIDDIRKKTAAATNSAFLVARGLAIGDRRVGLEDV